MEAMLARLMRLVNDENYPYPAETDNTICPDLVSVDGYGRHRSVCARGRRYWGFQTEQARDDFLRAVENGEFRRKMTISVRSINLRG